MSKKFFKFDLMYRPRVTKCDHNGCQFTILIKQVEVPRWNIFTKLPPKKRYGWVVFVQDRILYSVGTKLYKDYSNAHFAALKSIVKLTMRDQQLLINS